MRRKPQKGLALLLCVSFLVICGCHSSSDEEGKSGILSICFFKATAGVSKTINDLPQLVEILRFRSMYGDNAFSIKDEEGNVVLTGKDIKDVSVIYYSDDDSYAVSISFNEEGTKRFEEATRKAVESNNAMLLIYVADEVISSPRVQSVITDGSAVISGGFSLEEANDLEKRIYIALPPQEQE